MITETLNSFVLFQQKCRGLICPFTKTPFYGTCIQLVRNISGLTVDINFKIRFLEDWEMSDLNASESQIGQAIYNAFSKSIGLKRTKCIMCYLYVKRQSGSEATSPQLYLTAEIYTTSHCQFDRFIELVSAVLAKEIKIIWPGKSILPFRVSIDRITDKSTAKIMYGQNLIFCPRGYAYMMQNEMFCPQIEIERSEMASFTERAGKTQRWLFEDEEGKMNNSSNGSIRICLDEYFATFGQTNDAFFLSVAGRRIMVCHFVLGFIVYEYQLLLP